MFVYGIASKIPFSFNAHYLLLDVDTRDKSRSDYTKDFLEKRNFQMFWKESPHGSHGFCAIRLSYEECVHFIPLVPNVDEKWFSIGKNRGYWFLADYEKAFLPPYPLTPRDISYMRLKVPEGNSWLSTKHPKN